MSRRSADALLVSALAAGLSQAAAAQHAGVSERTVRRRLEDTQFAADIDQARASVVEHTSAQLLGATDLAVAALRDLVESAPPAVRVRAALGLLNAAAAWRESGETERRLAAFEAAAEQQAQWSSGDEL